MPIPGPVGEGEAKHKVDGYADDSKVWISNMTELTYLTQDAPEAQGGKGPIALWFLATNQIMSVQKFTVCVW